MKQLVLLTCMVLAAAVTGFGQKMDTVEQKAIQTLLNSRKATIEKINELRRGMDAEVVRHDKLIKDKDSLTARNDTTKELNDALASVTDKIAIWERDNPQIMEQKQQLITQLRQELSATDIFCRDADAPNVNLFICYWPFEPSKKGLPDCKEGSPDGKKRSPDCDNCNTIIKSPFNFRFRKPCNFEGHDGHAITPRYFVLDNTGPANPALLKVKNDRGSEYLKVRTWLRPLAGKFLVCGLNDDNDTAITLEVQVRNRHEEDMNAVKGVIDKETKKQAKPDTLQARLADSYKSVEANGGKASFDQQVQSLAAALSVLESRYPSLHAINAPYYDMDVRCLLIGIRAQFGLPEEFTWLDLKAKLAALDEGQGYAGNQILISAAAARFGSFIALGNRKVYTFALKVPNADYFKLVAKRNGRTVWDQEFRVSGGFKIDYSAGVFLTSISQPDFKNKAYTFRYKERNDSIAADGSVITRYTGLIKDSTGNRIEQEDPRLNFAAGFMTHGYVRTGTFLNTGIALGVLANDDGFQFLAGGSLMFSIHQLRFSLVGGCTWAKQTTLSPLSQPYLVDKETVFRDIYESQYELPGFSTADAPYVYKRWQRGYFFGLTYNFGSSSF